MEEWNISRCASRFISSSIRFEHKRKGLTSLTLSILQYSIKTVTIMEHNKQKE